MFDANHLTLANAVIEKHDEIEALKARVAELEGERDEAKRQHGVARENFHTMQLAADKLCTRAERAEARAAELEAALRRAEFNYAESRKSYDRQTQRYQHIMREAENASLKSAPDPAV